MIIFFLMGTNLNQTLWGRFLFKELKTQFPRYEGCHPVVMLHGVKNRTDLLTRHLSNIPWEGVLLHHLRHSACSFVPTAASHLWSCSVQEHNPKCDIATVDDNFCTFLLCFVYVGSVWDSSVGSSTFWSLPSACRCSLTSHSGSWQANCGAPEPTLAQ